jgi:multidrug efflux system outer membrane protein
LWLASGLLPILASACVQGPDYQRPAFAQPDQFRADISHADASSFADLAWWDVFNDKALQALINASLANNYNLQVAAARIEQARAMVGVARSEGQPQINYGLVGGGEKTVTPQHSTVDTASFGSIGGAVNAAWELDIWGRIKRSTEAAKANMFAQEEVRRGIMLTLVSDIANGYFRLLQLDRELAIAQESQTAYTQTHSLFSLRFSAGKDSRLPVERGKAALDASNATIAELKQAIAEQENALSLLSGGYPHAIERGAPLTAQTLPPMTPTGLTTDLLLRRPDIRQAEQVMVGANAKIGEAIANFYPKIGLSALAGFIGVDGSNGISGTFSFWRAGASIAGPLFSGGKLESEYAARKAFWDESVASYKQTVLVAFRETSDALAAQQNLVARRAALETQVDSLRQSVDLSMIRYRGGRASYFEVLEAQQRLYPTEDELARVQQAQLVAVVNLYKALGGGWKLSDDQWSHPG